MLARPLFSSIIQQSQRFALSHLRGGGVSRCSGFSSSARSSWSQKAGSPAFSHVGHASSNIQRKASSSSLLLLVAGGSSLFICQAAFTKPALSCEATTSAARPYAEPYHPSIQGPGSSRLSRVNDSPAVESSLDLRSLSFGAVAGICTGIFVKKGLKAVGFLLGGAFVFLQYMASRGMVNVDWSRMAKRYESVVDTYSGTGTGNRLQRVGGSAVDFLVADFPPRAVFISGLILGLRLG